MSNVLATIDEDTERKLVDDRRQYGVAYMRVLADGRIEHVPHPDIEPPTKPTAQPWLRRMFE